MPRAAGSTAAMNWLAVLFTLGYAGQAALLVVLGTAATPALRAMAVGNALLCALLLWTWYFVLAVRRPRESRRHLVLVAVLLLVPAFFLPRLAGWYEEAAIALRTADTDLHDVTDEPLYTAAGNVLGVRVGFTLIPPETGYYTIEPTVRAPAPEGARLREALRAKGLDEHLAGLRSVRRVIDPAPTAINARRLADDVLDHAGGGLYLEEGVAYGFTFDLLPGYLHDPRDPLPVRSAVHLDGYCLALPETASQREPFRLLESLDERRPWRIAVQQTTFGWDGEGRPVADTAEVYAPADFLRGARDEGIPACVAGP